MDIMTEKISHSIKLESNLSTIQFSNNGNYLMLDTYNSGAYYRKDSNTLYDTKSFKSIYTENHPHGHDIPYKIFGKNDKSIYGGYRNSYRNDNIINIYKWD